MNDRPAQRAAAGAAAAAARLTTDGATMTDQQLDTAARGPAAAADRGYPRIVQPPPGPRARAIIEKDERFSSTSYIKEYPLVVAHGRGAMIEDVDGNRFLDFMAGIAVAATGHAHPAVVAAIREAAGRFLHICGTDFYYQPFSELCERLALLAPGSAPKRVFLTNSGAEAVEGAIKLVRRATGRTDLIAFRGAFHGRTYGAMSLTSSKAMQRKGFGPFVPGVHHVPYPDPYRMGGDAGDVAQLCLQHIRDDLFARHVAPSDVAAVFIEPMLGEGGYIIPPAQFLTGLRELCDEHGIVLVFDEVQTGVGRTGRMWAAEHSGVVPDVLLAGKGLGSGMPIGAIVADAALMKWESGSHGSTYGGNPVACAAALATLELVERELLGNAQRTGDRLLAGLRALQQKHAVIGDVRGRGLFIGVEFVADAASRTPDAGLVDRIVQNAFRQGLLLLGCGRSTLRLAPPLVIDDYDVDSGLAILDACISAG
jgi:4-aminobutyrate aminotransferase